MKKRATLTAFAAISAFVPLALPSCSTLVTTTVRDAVIGGVGEFTQDVTVNLLDQFLGIDDTQPG